MKPIYQYGILVYGTADKKVMKKLKINRNCWSELFLKKKVRIDTQFAIKIKNTISEGTSYLRALEAYGSCFKINTVPSTG